MPQPRTPYRSAFRNSRATSGPPQPPSLSSPVGADTSMTAGDQATALRAPDDENGAWNQLDNEQQSAISGAYATGGFEGVAKAIPNWYDLPESTRTQILSSVRG